MKLKIKCNDVLKISHRKKVWYMIQNT